MSEASNNTQNQESSETKDTQEEQHFTIFTPDRQSPFSNGHRAAFGLNGLKYNCVDQYIQHQKAVLFKDTPRAHFIMRLDHPDAMRLAGRRVRGFKQATWDSHKIEIVKRGLRAKYTQNPELRRTLFATACTTLVNADPRDPIWGVGLPPDDPDALENGKWKGANLLGKLLTDMREWLMRVYQQDPDHENITS